MNALPLFMAISALALVGCADAVEVPLPAPVAEAGMDQVRFLQADSDGTLRLGLDGRASCDPLGEALVEAHWEVLVAPAGATFVWEESENPLRHHLTVQRAGEYVVGLTVQTHDRVSDPDVVTIEVRGGEGTDRVLPPPQTDACGGALP
jgi:hypothetical protein